MDYQPQFITIKTSDEGDVTFEAMIAIGTGLAYHRNYAGKGKFYKAYTVTHLASGYCIGKIGFDNVDAVQCFLELIAPLADWSQSQDILKNGDRQTLMTALRNAREKAEELSLSRMGASDE